MFTDAKEAQLTALRARAKAIGYRVHRRGVEYHLIDKDGRRVAGGSLDAMPGMLDMHDGTAFRAERKRFLAEHPRCTLAEYAKMRTDPTSELFKWRAAKSDAYDRKMNRAWLRENPGEHPLPLGAWCSLDHPYPGYKRWAAKVIRWMDRYEASIRGLRT
jgi:hypothetical protein